jgi:hypothetical protein
MKPSTKLTLAVATLISIFCAYTAEDKVLTDKAV